MTCYLIQLLNNNPSHLCLPYLSLNLIQNWLLESAAFNLPVAPHAYCLQHLHPAMATPNLLVVEMLGIEWDPMVKWLVDPPMPDGGYWQPDPERPGNGIELDAHAVAKYKLD